MAEVVETLGHLAEAGAQTAIGYLAGVDKITPLEVIGRDVLPRITKLRVRGTSMSEPNIPNLPGMGNAPTMQAQLSSVTGRVLLYCDRAVDGLTVDQLRDTRGGLTNSIGFDVWHVVRTIDNIIHFVFEREQPVWLREAFHERWGLPKVDQGTGMDPNDAYSMTFPEPEEFRLYTKAVGEAVVPKLAAMSDSYLAQVQTIRPWGPIPRMEAILHGLIGHGNGHLGRASYARTMFGLDGLPY